MRAVIGLGLAGVLVVAANERLRSWNGGARTEPVLRGVLNLQDLAVADGSGIAPAGEADPNANPVPDPKAGADKEEEPA